MILLAGLLLGTAPQIEAQNGFTTDSTGFLVRVLKNGVYGPGEQFVFDVKYGFVKGGEAGIEIMPGMVTWRGAPCLHIHTWAKSSKTFSKFFKVDDQINSYMDARGLFTWYFEKKLNEGSYHDIKVVDYDQRLGKAYTSDDGVPKDTGNIVLYVQDAITSLYYYRLLPLDVGKALNVDVYDINKLYPLRVDITGRETVKVPAGTFRCIKVEPKLESAGIFKGKGKLTLWLTDDERHIPVQMQTKVLIGSISAELKKYTPGTPVQQAQLLAQNNAHPDTLAAPDSTRNGAQNAPADSLIPSDTSQRHQALPDSANK